VTSACHAQTPRLGNGEIACVNAADFETADAAD
jgi:hypothetical protein